MKKLISLLLAVTMVFALAACGNTPGFFFQHIDHLEPIIQQIIEK